MAHASRPGSMSPYATRPYSSIFKLPTAIGTPYKLDEGYSEETRSQTGSDGMARADSAACEAMDQDPAAVMLPDWALGMSESERIEFTYALLRSLRTSSIAAIVERLNPLLHIDPVNYLPLEIIFEVFSYLDPESLLRASTLSKEWRTKALDRRLWRQLFASEGWTSNVRQVRAFEETQKARIAESKKQKTRVRPADSDDDAGDKATSSSKRRVRERPLFGDGSKQQPSEVYHGSRDWVEQHGTVEADGDERMQDVTYGPLSPRRSPTTAMADYLNITSPTRMDNSLYPPIKPSLILDYPVSDPRVNWQYLYKQRRRLEENWKLGRFTNFQLPHPAHAYEAHEECVYTIQYSGKFLVSGSRDKTLRIWNLETQRLVVPALRGHEASVLCLQFDCRPEQDIVISGGSDCHIILWRFSTGELVRKLPKAHSESVLNLRFDDRYLVTCSKDKTIKVWNRRQLLPTDADYPDCTLSNAKFPSYIINMRMEVENQHLRMEPLREYSLLMTLHGHTAAVNAIQILGNEIVSASGDRKVKLWDARTGACVMTVSAHDKGIACVQFDGRRIVSGSSDFTVRIFDRKAKGAEVACLRGHENLVRTVQARFGDLPGDDEEQEAEARAIDKSFFKASANGEIPESRALTREQRRARNAGSRRPKDLFAYGTKLPPGGGGGRWARIVSGSYDESVIIWKRSSEGEWVIAHKLHQLDAIMSAGGQPRANHRHGHHHHTAQGHGQAQPHAQANAQAHAQAQAASQQQQQQAQTQAAQPDQASSALVQQAQAQLVQAQQTVAQAHHIVSQQQPMASNQSHAQTVTNTTTTTQATAPTPQQQQQQLHHPPTAAATTTTTTTHAPTNPAPQPHAQPQAHPPHHHHHHHHHHGQQAGGAGGAPGAGNGSNSRVFKLQFDARRIICCSQDPTIVGWDFANGDADIIAASRFFGEE